MISRNIESKDQINIQSLLKESILFAQSNQGSSQAYVKKHAQELATDVVRQHIQLYVNEFSIDLGMEGKNAIQKLYERSIQAGLFPEHVKPETEKLFV